MPVRVAAALLLVLLCSPAQAADPWAPFRKAFPGPREPVVVTPLPPVEPPKDEAMAAVERALAEAEAATKRAEEAAARAEEALRVALPDPKSPVPPLPPPRPRQPTPLAPCLGPPLAQSCEDVCYYATRYTERELMAMRAVGIATKQIEDRPLSCQEKQQGRACIRRFCKDAVKR